MFTTHTIRLLMHRVIRGPVSWLSGAICLAGILCAQPTLPPVPVTPASGSSYENSAASFTFSVKSSTGYLQIVYGMFAWQESWQDSCYFAYVYNGGIT
ncbi:exported hypothetical protein [Candidatus Sulfopaludibacter sp. SbA4]|nr:exported hypothetical protein [Candidatus Sulfopaludibacter sp. SbA4]